MPLMIAATNGHLESVRLLLIHRTNVHPTPTQRKLPICSAMAASSGERSAMAGLIADHMNLKLLRTGYDNQVILLTIAAAIGRDEIVQELLQQGYYPHDTWSEGAHQF